MTLYIIRPKTTLLGRFPNLAARKITAESRDSQIQEVAHFWQEEPSYQDIQRWIQDAEGFDVKPIFTNLTYPTLTGTTLVEMPDEEAERMGRELKETIVLKDEPIELIRPIQDETKAKETLEIQDIWHLSAIRKSELQQTGKNVKIAVFDTGIDPNHPEIQGKVTESYSLNFQGKIGQWTVDPTPSQDTEGHGTHVAGLICGKTVGVAPEAQLINMLLLPQGRGTVRNFILALEWLLYRTDIRIVNISAGVAPKFREEMSDIINDLLTFGILPICAVGNDGRNRTRSPGNCQGVISVGATNQNGKVAGFSSSARMEVDNQVYYVPSLVAPGEDIYSLKMDGGYAINSGTSMATPIVSGIAALILEEDSQISAYDLGEALLDRCQRLEGQRPERQGEGIIQVA